MGWKDRQEQPANRPNTLGDTWRRMSGPRQPPPGGLPPLPDWPPLPGTPSQSGSSGRGWLSDDDTSLDTSPPIPGDEMLSPSWLLTDAPERHGTIFQRLRGISKRAKLALTATFLILLIGSASGIALHLTTTSPNGSASLTGSSLIQTTGHNGTPGASPAASPTVTTGPTATPQPLTLTFTCASGSLRSTGQVCVHTLPQTVLSLTIRYCDGTYAKGLHGNATADAAGNYTWSWVVRTSCVGTATATVTGAWNGQSVTKSDSFAIAR